MTTLRTAPHATDRTWIIRDIDGKNPREVTLAQYRAEVDAAKAKAEAIYRANAAKVRS